MAERPHRTAHPADRARTRGRASRVAWAVACALVVFATMPAGTAFAAPAGKESAKRHFARGRALYEGGKYMDALVEFKAARDDYYLPEHDYNIGQCLLKLDIPDEAAEAFAQFLRAKPDDPEADRLRALVVELNHRAENDPLRLRVPARRGSKARALRIAGLSLSGAGVALLGSGLALGLLAKKAGDDLTALDRAGAPFDPALERAGKRYELAEILCVAAGGAIAITGLTMFSIGERERPSRAAVKAAVIPVWTGRGGGISLAGTF